ncbi:hypothetical protein L596_006481 [Steinernema carpocapsae]|uniref:Uncharacterized protein n=1 Tax=Steinernema carpocapsae TaxID=34508 RepID=A0A4U8V268_STECR|nr:hypothetical protein L596_006481 [Steinernema carpocapsae]
MAELANNKSLVKAIKKVTNWQEVCDMVVYRYNPDKMFAWLQKKYEVIQKHIKSHDLVSKMVLENEDAFKRVSFYLLQEYLPENISAEAKQRFGIKELESQPNPNKRAAEVDDLTEFATTVQQPQQKKQASKVSATQKQLKQASKGTKSLMSFFSAKAPAK